MNEKDPKEYTVGELIKELKNFDKDRMVCIGGCYGRGGFENDIDIQAGCVKRTSGDRMTWWWGAFEESETGIPCLFIT